MWSVSCLDVVVASRIIGHMGADGGGTTFLRISTASGRAVRRSTRSFESVTSSKKLRRGGVAIAVSTDVKNAFNFVPWSAIRDGLVLKSVPDYLASLLGSFFLERKISYEKPDGTTETASVF